MSFAAKDLSIWIAGARPKTLPAAVVPVVVGTLASLPEPIWLTQPIWWRMVLALVVALAIQVATNYVNDYSDGQRGVDDDRLGPVRLVGSGMASVAQVKKAAGIAFAVSAIAGFTLAATIGWELLLVGALSILAGWAYTGGPKPYGYYGMGEVFVFVFFGLVATSGSAYLQAERWQWFPLLVAVPVGLLSVALLVVNNLRDLDADASSGKRTLAVRVGAVATRRIYVSLFVVSGLTIALSAIWRPTALFGLVGFTGAVAPVRQVVVGTAGFELIKTLELTARAQLLIGLCFSIGLALS